MKAGVTTARAAGFGLVELLVAVAIGLIVTAAMVQIYLGGQQSYRAQQRLARAQESGRTAVDLLGRYVRLAGHRNNFNSYLLPEPKVFDGPTLEVSDGADGVSLAVRFQGNGETADCQGAVVPADRVSVNRFAVRNNTLACSTKAVPTEDDWTPLVGGISGLGVLLGEDLNGDQVVDRYKAVAEADQNQALSLRLSVDLAGTPAAPRVATTVTLRNRITIGLGG